MCISLIEDDQIDILLPSGVPRATAKHYHGVNLDMRIFNTLHRSFLNARIVKEWGRPMAA